MIKTLQKLVGIMAAVLWIVVILVIVIAIARHQFWQLTPFIAYNRPQGIIGWMITVAFICTIVSSILKLVDSK